MRSIRPSRLIGFTVLVLAAGFALIVLSATGDYPPGSSRARKVDRPGPTGPPVWAGPRVEGRSVVVLLFDGLAPSMLEAQPTPTFDRLRSEGASTHHLVPAFPTVSMVNGFTITTGCWPERHGIVGNDFLDPQRGIFASERDADWIAGCEPLHVAAERQGVRSASLGWYAGYSSIRGWLVSQTGPDGLQVEFEDRQRTEELVALLGLEPDERPRLILAYFHGTDDPAHYNGLDSSEVHRAVDEVDSIVARVLQAIEQRDLAQQVTLVVTTDHGMIPANRLINVERILRRNGIRADFVGAGSVGLIYLEDPQARSDAQDRLARYDEFAVIDPQDPPQWSRLGGGPRVPNLILSANPPHFIEDRASWPWWTRWLALYGPEFADASFMLRATHGYPPDTPGVQGIFYAWGAGIRPATVLSRMDAVDIHPTLARLLDIRPGDPVDGRVLDEILRQ